MGEAGSEHTLEYLLAFDGREHHYPEGYFVKFEIKRVVPTPERPHGLRYSFSLHGPGGTRLVGFDNAHPVVPAGSRYRKKPVEADHWHRTENDRGRPYRFVSPEKLIDDFFDEVERTLDQRGIELVVVETTDRKHHEQVQDPEPQGPAGTDEGRRAGRRAGARRRGKSKL